MLWVLVVLFLLQGPHTRVRAIGQQQVGVPSTLDHMARLQHDDFVGMHDSRQTVGNNQRRLMTRGQAYLRLDGALITRI